MHLYVDKMDPLNIWTKINELNFDSIIKIMQDMKWMYGVNKEVVTEIEVKNMVGGLVRSVLNDESSLPIKSAAAGGFLVIGRYSEKPKVNPPSSGFIRKYECLEEIYIYFTPYEYHIMKES